jgi:hypothetical protein
MSEGSAANPLPGTSEPSFVRLAEAHRREGLVEDAIRICREGLAKLPASLRGRIVLGQCLLDRGAIGEAIVELGRVERESGGDPEILALLCEVRLAGPQRLPVGADLGVAAERPVETPVLILEEPGAPESGEAAAESAEVAPLASSTLAGLYANQGDREMAETILSQMTPEETPPAEDAPRHAEQGSAAYLAELARLRHVAERLRKSHPE